MSAPHSQQLNPIKFGDWLLAICVILGAAIYLHAASQLPHARSGGDPVGPAAFPYLIGSGLLGSGVLLLVELWRKKPATEIEAEVRWSSGHWKQLVGMACWTALYFYCFEPIGYLLATALYLWPMLIYFNPRHWIANTVIAVSFSFVVYLIFVKLLFVSLPAGVLAY